MKNYETMQAVPIGMGMSIPAKSKYGQFYADVIYFRRKQRKYAMRLLATAMRST